MSSGDAGSGSRRVRVFTASLWIVGSIVAAFAIYQGVSPIRITDTGEILGVGEDYGDYPWEDPNVPVVEVGADGAFTAPTGNSVMRLPAEDLAGGPLQLVTDDDDTYAGLSLSAADELGIAPGDDHPWPEYYGSMSSSRPGVLVPTGSDVEVWIESEQQWDGRVEPLESTPLVDTVSGTGQQFLTYDGDAISARLEYDGDRYITVISHTATRRDYAVSEEGPLDMRFAWPDDGAVVLFVDSNDDDEPWHVTVEGGAGTDDAGSATPTPAPTATPTE